MGFYSIYQENDEEKYIVHACYQFDTSCYLLFSFCTLLLVESVAYRYYDVARVALDNFSYCTLAYSCLVSVLG